MLSRHGIAFDAYDVAKTPDAFDVLRRFRIPLVPAVIVGERYVHGWNPRGLAELFAWEYEEAERLTNSELLGRLDRLLDVTQQSLRQIPDEHYGYVTLDQGRLLGDLGDHVFRIGDVFVDAADQGQLPAVWFRRATTLAAPRMALVVAYGDEVRAKLRAWIGRAPADVWQRPVDTYYGPSHMDELLDRTVWHCAQHVRQIQQIMGELGIGLARPLTPDDLRGLPLPEAIW